MLIIRNWRNEYFINVMDNQPKALYRAALVLAEWHHICYNINMIENITLARKMADIEGPYYEFAEEAQIRGLGELSLTILKEAHRESKKIEDAWMNEERSRQQDARRLEIEALDIDRTQGFLTREQFTEATLQLGRTKDIATRTWSMLIGSDRYVLYDRNNFYTQWGQIFTDKPIKFEVVPVPNYNRKIYRDDYDGHQAYDRETVLDVSSLVDTIDNDVDLGYGYGGSKLDPRSGSLSLLQELAILYQPVKDRRTEELSVED